MLEPAAVRSEADVMKREFSEAVEGDTPEESGRDDPVRIDVVTGRANKKTRRSLSGGF